jgi:hypothetical protein
MSILTLKARPIVAFDETDPLHREYFYEFVKRGTWGYSPVRFMADEASGDLVTFVSRKMLNYYVKQEFEGKRKRPSAKTRTSAKSKAAGSYHIVHQQ